MGKTSCAAEAAAFVRQVIQRIQRVINETLPGFAGLREEEAPGSEEGRALVEALGRVRS